uniref:Uncharacterized protein n=1 Tax=Anguilla anguilla TaxID=7936 RepID=A0A0E9PJT4_ANGAN
MVWEQESVRLLGHSLPGSCSRRPGYLTFWDRKRKRGGGGKRRGGGGDESFLNSSALVHA